MLKRPRRFIETTTSVVAVFVLAALSVSACGNDSSASGATGKDFYKGKTLTFISPDKPGAQTDILFRIIGPAVCKVLGCTAKVVDVPEGGSITGQEQAMNARADGLTIGREKPDEAIADKAAGKPIVSFALDAPIFLGGTPPPQNVMVSSAKSDIKSFQDVLNATDTVNILTTGGSASVTLEALIAAYDLKHAKLVKGYAHSAELVQGLLRGDGPVTDTSLATLVSIIKAGQAIPILQMSDPVKDSSVYDKLKDVPTLQDLLDKNPPSTADGVKTLQALVYQRATPRTWFFTTPGTPQDRVDALRAAFKQVMNDPEIMQKEADQGEVPGFIDPSEAKDDLKKLEEAEQVVIKFSK